MSFTTRLSQDELRYLAGLADMPDAGEHIGNCMELGWQRWDEGLMSSWWCEQSGATQCYELWVHHVPGIATYYRHGYGEAIAKLIDVGEYDRSLDTDEALSFTAWLRAIHQHREVLV